MVEARRELRFLEEATTEALIVRQLRVEQLEGDPGPTPRVFGEVHRAHAPFADQRLHAKPARTVPVGTSDRIPQRQLCSRDAEAQAAAPADASKEQARQRK